MRPIKVDYIISAVTTGQAGTEGHVFRLVRGLDRSRVTPRIITLQDSPAMQGWNDSTTPLLSLGFTSFKSFSAPRAVFRLARLLRANQTDIAELYFTDAHLIGAVAARLAGTKAVISCRRNLAYQYGRKERLLSRLGNPGVHVFLANSLEVIRHIARVEKLSEDRFRTISNGVDLDTFDAESRFAVSEAVRTRLSGRKCVALLANLRPVKNVQMFLTAAYYVLQEFPETVFLVMGAGPDEESLKRYALELEIGDHVVWAGSAPAPAAYLRHCVLGVLTSNSEGFSNAILEYMAAGLPVVATRVGGASEAIEDSRTGFLIEPGDFASLAGFIQRYLRDDNLRVSHGSAGRAKVEREFTFSAMLGRYYALYEELSPGLSRQ